MTSTELREKLTKAQEKVTKIENTISKHYASAEKKKATIEKNGWGFDAHAMRDNNEAFWTIVDYEGKLDDAKNAEKKLEDAKQVVANWEAKLTRQLEIEHKLQTEIPEVFKIAKEYLVENWVACDIREREAMYKAQSELPYSEFKKLYTYSRKMDLSKTDEEFKKIEEREAEMWLLDLYNRVYAITGKITDASRIHWGGKCLDGTIKGEAGTAVVETIGAGGYNIVRYHLRTLVKEA